MEGLPAEIIAKLRSRMSWSWQTKEERVLAKRRVFAKGQKGAGCIGKAETFVVVISAPNGNDWLPCLPPSPFCFTLGSQCPSQGLVLRGCQCWAQWDARVESPKGRVGNQRHPLCHLSFFPNHPQISSFKTLIFQGPCKRHQSAKEGIHMIWCIRVHAHV